MPLYCTEWAEIALNEFKTIKYMGEVEKRQNEAVFALYIHGSTGTIHPEKYLPEWMPRGTQNTWHILTVNRGFVPQTVKYMDKCQKRHSGAFRPQYYQYAAAPTK